MSDRIIGERYVEVSWICTSCSHTNRGRDMRCVECSSPKDKSENDNAPITSAPAVTDPALLAEAKAGPNRLCPYCKAQIRALDGKCGECGAAKTAAAARKPTPQAVVPARFPLSELHIAGFVIAIALTVCAAYWVNWFFSMHRTHATVIGASWTVTRSVRTRTTVHGSGWGSPFGAFNTSCSTRYYGDRDCDPYSCRYRQEEYTCRPYECRCRTYETTSSGKNGYAKVTTHQRCDTCYETCTRQVHDTCWRRCPVYRDWCEYDSYEWPVTATLTTSGTGQDVHDPALVASGPLERLEQTEVFNVKFAHKDRSWSLSPSRADYARYRLGSEWAVEVNRAGSFNVIEGAK